MLRFPVQEVKLVRMHLIGSQVLRSHIRLLGLLQSPTHRGRMHAQMVGSLPSMRSDSRTPLLHGHQPPMWDGISQRFAVA